MKKLLLLSLLTLALSVTGCGSKSKKASDAASEDQVVAAMDSEGLNLEMAGTSDDGKAGPIKTVFFAFNSANLTNDSRDVLTANADFLKSNEAVEIQVEGHCDERGGVQYNLALGQKRANSIKNYLVAMGVAANRVTTISYGKEKAIAYGHEESAWGQNRRGNFAITNK